MESENNKKFRNFNTYSLPQTLMRMLDMNKSTQSSNSSKKDVEILKDMLDNELKLLYSFLEYNFVNDFYENKIESSALSEKDEILVVSSKSVISFWDMSLLFELDNSGKNQKQDLAEAKIHTIDFEDDKTWFLQIDQQKKQLITISSYANVKIYDIKRETLSQPPILYEFDLFKKNQYEEPPVKGFKLFIHNGKRYLITGTVKKISSAQNLEKESYSLNKNIDDPNILVHHKLATYEKRMFNQLEESQLFDYLRHRPSNKNTKVDELPLIIKNFADVVNRYKYEHLLKFWKLTDLINRESGTEAKCIKTINHPFSESKKGSLMCFAIDQSRNQLFCGSQHEYIKIWKMSSDDGQFNLKELCCSEMLHNKVKQRFGKKNNGTNLDIIVKINDPVNSETEEQPYAANSIEVIEKHGLLIVGCIKPYSILVYKYTEETTCHNDLKLQFFGFNQVDVNNLLRMYNDDFLILFNEDKSFQVLDLRNLQLDGDDSKIFYRKILLDTTANSREKTKLCITVLCANDYIFKGFNNGDIEIYNNSLIDDENNINSEHYICYNVKKFGAVNCMSNLKEEKQLICCSDDNTIKIIDYASFEEKKPNLKEVIKLDNYNFEMKCSVSLKIDQKDLKQNIQFLKMIFLQFLYNIIKFALTFFYFTKVFLYGINLIFAVLC